MIIFEDCTVLDVRTGVTKNGQPYAVLRFLVNSTYDLFDGIWQFGDSAAVASGLSKGAHVSLGFSVVPSRQGGVSLRLDSVGKID